MVQFLKNQKHLFIAIVGGLSILTLAWYFLLHQKLSSEYKKSKQIKRSITDEVDNYRQMESQIVNMQDEWDILNTEFETVIESIPDKILFDGVTDHLYSLILNHGLTIKMFSPSDAAIEKKTIQLPISGDEILIEKFPIDIVLKGSFINFGQLLESLLNNRYRFTASNIKVAQKESASIQTIELISYAYFQSGIKKPLAKITTLKNKKIRSPKPAPEKIADVIPKNENMQKDENTIENLPDSLKDLPEMWFEPATEPMIESRPITESEPITESKPITESEPAIVKKGAPAPAAAENKVFYNIVILDSKVCKKVKNNQPMDPGRIFPSDIGRVYCHSLLDNNSGKHNDVYHIWYMNGELKAKVRIRVRDGKEIPAVSHREVTESDKGTWRVEITDSDKKILDTIIFELV